MKTSNKLLLGLLALCFVIFISMLTIVRSHASMKLPMTGQNIDDNTYTINFNSPVESTIFNLGHNNKYFLDSSKEGITIKGPKYATESLQIQEGNILQFDYESSPNNPEKEELTIIIGTQNVNLEKLMVSGNAECESDEQAPVTSPSIELQGNAQLYNITVDTPSLSINCSGNSKATLDVESKKISANTSGNSKLKLKNDNSIINLDVAISGNTYISAYKADIVSGVISGNGKLDVQNVKNKGNIITSGNGRDRSNYPE